MLTLWKTGAHCHLRRAIAGVRAWRDRHARRDRSSGSATKHDLPAGLRPDRTIELAGRWLTPGLVDCHTHLVFAGQRAAEFARRTAGTSYADIAREGGGILSTVRATRAASDELLLEQSGRGCARCSPKA